VSRAYGIFRLQLLGRILAEALTPAEVAEALEREGLAQTCSEEIARYRAWGDRWPGSHQSAKAAPVAPITPESVSNPVPSQGILDPLEAWGLEA
jgi:hypothetical protein